MKINDKSLKPLFAQVASWAEDEILKGNIQEGDKIFSQMEFAKIFNINPLTAGKGVQLLESKGIVEKKRGLGMFVVENAKEKIYEYRKNESIINLLDELVVESKTLELSYQQICTMLKERMEIVNKESEND